MPDPHIAAKEPKELELEPGTYLWCTCGLSEDGVWCDGAHRGKGFAPMKFVVEEKKTVWLCQCKHTQGKPFCDGSHSKL